MKYPKTILDDRQVLHIKEALRCLFSLFLNNTLWRVRINQCREGGIDGRIKISILGFAFGIVLLGVGIFFFTLGLMYCGHRIETGGVIESGLFSILSWAFAIGAFICGGFLLRNSVARTKKEYFCAGIQSNSPVCEINGRKTKGWFVIAETWRVGGKDRLEAMECFTGLPIEKNEGRFYFKDYPLVMFPGIRIDKDKFADFVQPLYSHKDECVRIVFRFLKEETERLEAENSEKLLKQREAEAAKKAKEEWVDKHF